MHTKRPRKRSTVNFEINGTRITPVKSIRYLGVILSERLNFGEHIKKTSEKAEKKMSALTRILPNIGGPGMPGRRILYGVVESVILYAAPVWYMALDIHRNLERLQSVQRRALLKVASGYRTISTAAIQVITGIPPNRNTSGGETSLT
ncbi:hypothetical protein NQ317_001949 [Molorchus minor]|uniref:Reverse transcriptase domain-containing protein n=1 Tax=Molorchus minor TaxID=1323400 RepID=A0ABQ9IVX5_9CUCU|nr:hypothetical protein NQ317_001949 [Molorchus minor]